MPGIFRLFDIFALLYVFRSFQLTAVIWREWRQLVAEPFTRKKKRLAEQASFFISVPIGVLVHEFGHALATWLFGGRVVEFGYRAFWGYVIPSGEFSATQEWFISLAGTLGSLLFGVGIWLLFRRHKASTLRYFGLRSARFQVYFSLIYYPVFTLLGFLGDWRTIYNFQATPLASAMTAPFHAGLLFLFWWGDRAGWFEMPHHESAIEREQFLTLLTETAANPHDARLQLSYIDALRRGGAVNQAKRKLARFIQQHPDSASGYLQLATVKTAGQTHIPKEAVEASQKALSLGLADARQAAFAHQLIGRHYLDVGDADQVITHLSQAVTLLNGTAAVNPAQVAQLLHWRSQAYRRQRRYEQAYQDLCQAITSTRKAGDEQMASFYQSDLDVLAQHAGRAFPAPSAETISQGGDLSA
ncbi:MAG: M50 family metallopeptidase [Anaerolineae bacterium]